MILHTHFEDFVVNPVDPAVKAHAEGLMGKHADRLPKSVKEALERAGKFTPGGRLKGSGVNWRDMLSPRDSIAASGTQVAATTTETIMCPDFVFPARMMEAGDAFKYTLFGDMSTVITTPGTITFRLRWGGVAGTVLAASGAFAPSDTAASTTVSYCVEWYLVARTVGPAGSMFCMGKIEWNDYGGANDDAAGLIANLNMKLAPVSAPAAVGSLDTTTAKALSPTVAFSVATAGTQLTNHIALLESLN